MPSMKMIKRRIGSVKSTQQIMKAMNLVAASKLQRAKENLAAVRPLFQETKKVMDKVRSCDETADNIFVVQREVKSTAYVILTSDRGLCGGYNSNICKAMAAAIKEGQKNPKVVAAGNKGHDYFRRRGEEVLKRYNGLSELNFYSKAQEIAELLVSMYVSGEVDEVYLAYTHFDSVVSMNPSVIKVLPVGQSTDEASGPDDMEYEPDINAFLEHAVPMYMNVLIYGAMVEAYACEQASRMVSMDAATDNAADIIESLTLTYNRKRQANITQEINEIVSGANALQ